MGKTTKGKRILNILIISLFAYQFIMFILWCIPNITAIPSYGDSPEYILLAESLQIDDYRGILYPLLVRSVLQLEPFLGVHYQSLIYLFQLGMSLLCWNYAVRSGILAMQQEGNCSFTKKNRILLEWMISLFLISTPIIAHFNFTFLTDSLALSTLAAYCGALVRLVYLKQAFWKTGTIATACFVLTSLLRTERIYLCLGVAVGVICLYRWILRYRFKVMYLLGAILLSTVIVYAVNANKSISDVTRPPLTIEGTIFSRCAWPRLEKTYPYLDEKTKQLFTIEQAREFDQQPQNMLYVFLPTVTQGDWEKLPSVYRAITPVCLQYFGGEIAYSVIKDAVNYIMAPFSIVLDYYSVISGSTYRTFTKMSEFSPVVTSLYFFPSFFGIPILILLIFLSSLRGILSSLSFTIKTLFPCILASLGISVGFVISAIVGPPNIRFGMMIYATWILVSVFFYLCSTGYFELEKISFKDE